MSILYHKSDDSISLSVVVLRGSIVYCEDCLAQTTGFSGFLLSVNFYMKLCSGRGHDSFGKCMAPFVMRVQLAGSAALAMARSTLRKEDK